LKNTGRWPRITYCNSRYCNSPSGKKSLIRLTILARATPKVCHISRGNTAFATTHDRISLNSLDCFPDGHLEERFFRSRSESQGGNQPTVNTEKVSSIGTDRHGSWWASIGHACQTIFDWSFRGRCTGLPITQAARGTHADRSRCQHGLPAAEPPRWKCPGCSAPNRQGSSCRSHPPANRSRMTEFSNSYKLAAGVRS
jgi:hypothetical protein